LGDRRENGRSLRAVGHAVRSVFDVAAGKDFSIRQKDCCAYVKLGIRRVRVSHHFDSRVFQFFPHTGGDGFLGHSGQQYREMFADRDESCVIVNP
jgi:hypothetical protein